MSRKPFELFRLSTTERNLMAVENANRAIEQDLTFHCHAGAEAIQEWEKQQKEINALKNPWQPIETCPKDGTRFDVWAPKIGRISDCKFANTGWGEDLFLMDSRQAHLEGLSWTPNPTHWMPIPEGPKST